MTWRCPQKLIQKFNFHHFDNLSASTPKLDPRRTCAEKRAELYRVLFAAAAGDLPAIRRYRCVCLHRTETAAEKGYRDIWNDMRVLFRFVINST